MIVRPVERGRADWLVLLVPLILLGAGWGLTQPMAVIARAAGYPPLGLVLWQLLLGAALLGTVTLLRRRPLSLRRDHVGLYVLIALIGTILPSGAAFTAAGHLPAGILSIVLSLVPMMAFPIALALGIDRFGAARLAGLCLGLGGVVLLSAPAGGLPEPGMAAWLPLALVAPLFYALEGNVVARWGTAGLDPVDLLFGASVAGAILVAPAVALTGTGIDPRPPWGAADGAVLVLSCVHAFVYAGYVWLVGRAGAVYAAQVSYLVTGFGVVWSMWLLGERYSGWVWAAMALMFLGLFLVQPRPRAAPDGAAA